MAGKTDLLYLLSQKLEGNWPSWKGENLTREVLENVLIEKNWSSLDVNLKLKLLFALTTLKKSVVKELSDVISKILELASQDNNKESEWVLVIARIFSTFMEGNINLENFSNVNSQVKESLDHLTSLLQEKDIIMIPMENAYLQKREPLKIQSHFTLKQSCRESKRKIPDSKSLSISGSKLTPKFSRMTGNEVDSDQSTTRSLFVHRKKINEAPKKRIVKDNLSSSFDGTTSIIIDDSKEQLNRNAQLEAEKLTSKRKKPSFTQTNSDTKKKRLELLIHLVLLLILNLHYN
jgi:hypothetical protein